MVELRRESRLVEEHRREVRVAAAFRDHALEHDVTLDAGLGGNARQENICHSAAGEPAEDRVAVRARALLGQLVHSNECSSTHQSPTIAAPSELPPTTGTTCVRRS